MLYLGSNLYYVIVCIYDFGVSCHKPHVCCYANYSAALLSKTNQISNINCILYFRHPLLHK